MKRVKALMSNFHNVHVLGQLSQHGSGSMASSSGASSTRTLQEKDQMNDTMEGAVRVNDGPQDGPLTLELKDDNKSEKKVTLDITPFRPV